MSIFSPTPIAYSSEGNSLRKPIQGREQMSQGMTKASPFAQVFAKQQAPQQTFMQDVMKAATEQGKKHAGSQATLHSPYTLKEKAAQAGIVAQVQMDNKRMQALEQMGQNMSSGGHGLLDMARNDVTMRNMRSAIGSFNLRAPVMPMADSIKASALQSAQRNMRMQDQPEKSMKDVVNTSIEKAAVNMPEIGKLSAQFESGSKGIAAIGYDRTGGTSYGKYQIASRVGSMDRFLNFLDTEAPEMAKTLRDAGPANTGSRKGGMPNAWREIAEEQPERFEALQEKFIYDSHYVPALSAINKGSSLSEQGISSVMREVLWSTAVQHGPAGAARIFNRALNSVGDENMKNFDEKLIKSVYAQRAEQFGSSTPAVQSAVRNRMQQEKNLALAMLKTGSEQA